MPHHWDSQPKDANGKEKDLHLVQLEPAKNQQEYDGLLAAVIKSSAINIVKIERVQNPELYNHYMQRKQKMDDKDGSKGFNRNYCGKNGQYFMSCFMIMTARPDILQSHITQGHHH